MRRFLAVLTFVSLLSPSFADAATVTWTGLGTDRNWSTTGNWSGNAVPASGDDVRFDSTGKTDSIADRASGTGAIKSLTLTSAFTGSLKINRNLSILGPLHLSGGTLDMRGTGATLSVYGDWLNQGATFLSGTGSVNLFGTGSNSLSLKETGAFRNLAVAPVDLVSNLVGYWKFDEGAGTTAADSSGNGNNGTLINGPTWTGVTAPLSYSNPQALSFDGVNSYVRIPDSSTLRPGSITTSAWFYLSSTPSPAKTVVGKAYNGPAWSSPFVSWLMRINSTTKLELDVGNGSTYSAQAFTVSPLTLRNL
jgi:hypothetical protein